MLRTSTVFEVKVFVTSHRCGWCKETKKAVKLKKINYKPLNKQTTENGTGSTTAPSMLHKMLDFAASY